MSNKLARRYGRSMRKYGHAVMDTVEEVGDKAQRIMSKHPIVSAGIGGAALGAIGASMGMGPAVVAGGLGAMVLTRR